MTTNYGLAGGKLDATKHIEAAIPKLLTPREIVVRQAGLMVQERAVRAARSN
jgi:hypothetical protein